MQIYNACLSNGTFSCVFKNTVVVLIHKGNNPSEVRPISLTNHLAKILKKCVNKKLIQFQSRNPIISSNQFGFRQNVSTENAIHETTNRIMQAIDHKKKCMAIFQDLTKTIQNLSH